MTVCRKIALDDLNSHPKIQVVLIAAGLMTKIQVADFRSDKLF